MTHTNMANHTDSFYMTGIDYILNADRNNKNGTLTDEEKSTADSTLRSLSVDEVDTLYQPLDEDSVFYELCSCMQKHPNRFFRLSYYDPSSYEPYRRKTESFDCLLKWAKERVKGKMSYAKRILCANFEGYFLFSAD